MAFLFVSFYRLISVAFVADKLALFGYPRGFTLSLQPD